MIVILKDCPEYEQLDHRVVWVFKTQVFSYPFPDELPNEDDYCKHVDYAPKGHG